MAIESKNREVGRGDRQANKRRNVIEMNEYMSVRFKNPNGLYQKARAIAILQNSELNTAPEIIAFILEEYTKMYDVKITKKATAA